MCVEPKTLVIRETVRISLQNGWQDTQLIRKGVDGQQGVTTIMGGLNCHKAGLEYRAQLISVLGALTQLPREKN